jgi:hypothetical protein
MIMHWQWLGRRYQKEAGGVVLDNRGGEVRRLLGNKPLVEAGASRVESIHSNDAGTLPNDLYPFQKGG